MTGLPEVPRHLECQPSVWAEHVDQGRQQTAVPRNPLQCGVADDHVHRCFGPPVTQILDLERHPSARKLSGLLDHLW